MSKLTQNQSKNDATIFPKIQVAVILDFSRYDLNFINGQTKKVIGRVFFAPKNCNDRVDGIKLLNTRKHPFSESLQPINLLLGSVLMTLLIMGTTLFWKALIWVEQGKTILDFFLLFLRFF